MQCMAVVKEVKKYDINSFQVESNLIKWEKNESLILTCLAFYFFSAEEIHALTFFNGFVRFSEKFVTPLGRNLNFIMKLFSTLKRVHWN